MAARILIIAVLVFPSPEWIRNCGAAQPSSSTPVPGGPAAEAQEPVVGQMEHTGYGLVGSGGRHYIFGGLAMADYARGGRRHIVTLQLQEPTTLAKPDEDFLYYRELGSGHRWAIGRHPLKDDTYAVYFQPTSEGAAAAREVVAGIQPPEPAHALFDRNR